MASDVPPERDIELVLVTGAGASREFGVNGVKLPMMGEWSNVLVDKISRLSRKHLAATRLDKDLDGPEFEKRLGEFLHQVAAFQQAGPLVPMAQIQPASMPLPDSAIQEWYSQAIHHFGQITNEIHASLYEQFSVDRVDLDAAAAAYSRLLVSLGVSGTGALVLATTNYDLIGEHAIARLGGHPDWGVPPQLSNYGEVPLRVDGLLDGFPRYAPVLHLHGRIGWHRRNDGVVYSSNASHHDPGFGVPVVMLPDPDKSYDAEPVIFELWAQFERALQRAQRVFVLGHSLHDKPLVDALQRNVLPAQRVAIGLLARADDPEQPADSAAATMDIMSKELPRAAMIPLRFGHEITISAQGISTWAERLSLALRSA